MPLMLDDMRAEFARYLAEDPAGRFRLDGALAHIVTLAYQQGIIDGQGPVIATYTNGNMVMAPIGQVSGT